MPIGHHFRGYADLAEQGLDHDLVHGIVLDHQDPQITRGVERRLRRVLKADVRLVRRLQGQEHRETGAFSGQTFGGDVAAHGAAKFATDGQPKPRAAKAPGGRGIGLDELVEQVLQPRIVNADAGVAHHDPHAIGGGADADPHLALFSELDRVRDQVAEDLAQSGRIAEIGAGQIRIDIEYQGDIFLLRRVFEGLFRTRDQFRQRKPDRFNFQLARLDFRQIQNVVQNLQQGVAGAHDHRQLAVVGRRVFLARHGLGYAQNAVQRRADLVAHGGQKIALGLVGGLGGQGGFFLGAGGGDHIGRVDKGGGARAPGHRIFGDGANMHLDVNAPPVWPTQFRLERSEGPVLGQAVG